MKIEDKYLIALAVICVLLLAGGSLLASRLAAAPPRTIRTVWPIVAVLTAALFAGFVFIARTAVKG